jgi:type III secretion protein J
MTRLAAVMGVLALAAAGCSTNILQGIDERAANEAARALERAGIGAEKVADEGGGASGATYTLRVSRADGARALDLLRALGLPHERRRGFAETYGQPSLIPTPSEERARYVDALAGELERTLEGLDGVVSARVHLVLEENDPLAPTADGKPRAAARAAVLLTTGSPPASGHAPPPREDVQRLVAGSVAGLEPAAVAVVVTSAPPAPEGEPTMTAVGPLRVTPGSRGLLIAALAVALGVLGVLAGLLVVTARRLSALERGQPPR